MSTVTCHVAFDLTGQSVNGVRNVIKEQHQRIAQLERTIMQMRQRREWGDSSSSSLLTGVEDDETGMDEESTSSTASSSASSTASSTSARVLGREKTFDCKLTLKKSL